MAADATGRNTTEPRPGSVHAPSPHDANVPFHDQHVGLFQGAHHLDPQFSEEPSGRFRFSREHAQHDNAIVEDNASQAPDAFILLRKVSEPAETIEQEPFESRDFRLRNRTSIIERQRKVNIVFAHPESFVDRCMGRCGVTAPLERTPR